MVDETITEKKGKYGKEYFYGETKINTYNDSLEDFFCVQMEKIQGCIDIALENISGDHGSDREIFLLETVFDKVKTDIFQFIKDIDEHHGVIKLVRACNQRGQEPDVYIDKHKTLGIEFTPVEVPKELRKL